MELCSMMCGSLDGRGVQGRMDIFVCVAESFHRSSETITTLLIGYPQYKRKTREKKKKKSEVGEPLTWAKVSVESEFSGNIITS